jgi:hypothetical protein
MDNMTACTCTSAAKESQRQLHFHDGLHQDAVGIVDTKGNYICTTDSQGYRSRFPGECDSCYYRFVGRFREDKDS